MLDILEAPSHVAAFHLHGTLTGEDYDSCIAWMETRVGLHERIAVLADQHVVITGTAPEVMAHPHPFIQKYFLGGRGQRAAQALHEPPPVSRR